MRMFAAATALAVVACAANAATFTVTNANDAGAGSLRDAIAQANASAPPNFVNFNPSVTGTILLTSGQISIEQGPLTITGPGAGTLTIDGNLSDRIFVVIEAVPAACPLPTAPSDFLVSISGLTLANARRLSGSGGAINSFHSLALDSVVLRDNQARVGGAVNFFYQYPGQSLAINNSTFTNNVATALVSDTGADGGGAVRVIDNCARVQPVALSVTGSMFSNNAAQPISFPGRGGAIATFSYVDVTITDSRIFGNHVDAPNPPVSVYWGGGIYASVPKSVTIVRSEIADNDVKGGSAEGGALYVVNDDPTLQGPGSESLVKLVNTTVSGNSVTLAGGAMTVFGNVAVELDNSTISGNYASPTVVISDGILLTTGPTFPPSAANATAPTLTLQSTILAGNGVFDLGTDSLVIPGITINASHSLIGAYCSATCTISGSGNLFGADQQKLADLAFNGGPTRTQAPVAGSPAIDAGSNPLALATDQRGAGFARAIGAATDMGAFETHPLVVTNNNDSGPGSLRAVVAQADADPGPNIITFDPAVTGSIVLTSGQITIHDAVSIYGPGSGVLTINGNANSRIFAVLATNPACPALDGPDYLAHIANLRLTNGKAGGNSAGAIFSVHSLALENLLVDHNSSLRDGGAVSFVTQYRGQGLFIFGTTFDSNTVQPSGPGAVTGGAIAIYENCPASPLNSPVSVDIMDSTFTGNQAKPTTGGGFGGAIAANSLADITITRSRFVNNAVVAPNPPVAGMTYLGGALSAGARSLTIVDSELSGNQALDVTNSSSATDGGAFFLFNNAPFRQTAGGVMPVQIVNSTISGNSATTAGGAMVAFGNIGLEVDNATVAANTAFTVGGFVLTTGPTSPPSASNALPPTLTLVSSILANNTADDVWTNAAVIPTFTISATSSLIRSICPNPTCVITVTGSGNKFGVDPLLGPLANNGGTSQTMALLTGSPSINAGSNPLALTTDQRGTGFPRVIGSVADMGAFESSVTAVAPVLVGAKSRKTHGVAGPFDLAL